MTDITEWLAQMQPGVSDELAVLRLRHLLIENAEAAVIQAPAADAVLRAAAVGAGGAVLAVCALLAFIAVLAGDRDFFAAKSFAQEGRREYRAVRKKLAEGFCVFHTSAVIPGDGGRIGMRRGR